MVEAVSELAGPVDEVLDLLEHTVDRLSEAVLRRLDDDRLVGRLDRLGTLIGRLTGNAFG